MITQDILNTIKKELKEKKTKLLFELTKGVGTAVPQANDFVATYPNYGDGEDENAQEIASYDANIAIEKTLEENLQNINTALEKIKSNKYGICESCDNEIPVERLMAFPEAKHCVDCANKE